MATVITSEKKPLFQKSTASPLFFQDKKRIFIVVGLLVFIALIVGFALYFLNSDYSQQLATKVSLFIPFARKKD